MFHPRNINHSHLFADKEVTPDERDRRMHEIFHRLAPYYDRLLDVQSLGLHRYWRRVVVKMMAPRAGQCILDVAGGCGEMAKRLAAPECPVVVLEPSMEMIRIGRRKCLQNVAWVAGLARALPFSDASMDAVVCAFGLRNVTYVEPALKEILRVLKPGGRFYCLEVSRPWLLVRPLYRAYCRYLVPRLGRWVTTIPEAYDYLTASILEYPDKEECKRQMETVGFADVSYRCLTLDIVCIHVGTRPNT
jgi:demethylmenaquinone methyltransferase/2-methoxy-6-polyprenyl-1,4-benzoquinol methylase